MSAIVMTDSTTTMSYVADVLSIVADWRSQHRKGKITLHFDGKNVARLECDYYVDFKP